MKNTNPNPNSKLLMSIICIVLIVNGVYHLYAGVRSLAMYIRHNFYMNDYIVSIIFDFFIGLAVLVLGCIGLIFLNKPNKGRLCMGVSIVAMIIILCYPIVRFIVDLFNLHTYGMDTILGNLLNNFLVSLTELSVPVIFLVAFLMNYNQWRRMNPIPAPVQYSANKGGGNQPHGHAGGYQPPFDVSQQNQPMAGQTAPQGMPNQPMAGQTAPQGAQGQPLQPQDAQASTPRFDTDTGLPLKDAQTEQPKFDTETGLPLKDSKDKS